MGLLARREHSRGELVRKLSLRGFAHEAVELACDRLIERDLQSDRRFVESFVNSRAGRGDGPYKISQALRQRDVSRELIGECMAPAGVDWREAARAARERRFGSALPEDRRELARQMRFLQSRGFDAEQVRYATHGAMPADQRQVRQSEPDEG